MSKLRAILERLQPASASGFLRAPDGVAAVEFALILPVMLLMYLGVTELSAGYGMHRKLTTLSRSLADLTSRAKQVTTSDVQTIFKASGAILQPYDSSTASMVISSVIVTLGAGNTPVGTIEWSCAQLAPGTDLKKRTKGSLYVVPNGFENAASFILAESTYKYTPAFGSSFTPASGSYLMNQTTPWPVRNTNKVEWSGSSC